MHRPQLFTLVVLFFVFLAACDRPPAVIPPPDGGVGDGGEVVDGGRLVDGAVGDASADAGALRDGAIPDAAVDGGPIAPGTTVPTPPPTVVRTGTGGYLLRGLVLTPTGPLTGEVLVVGDTITCVAADCSATPMADTVTIIDAHGGVISPGLLNSHDHLSYDFLPEWVPDPARLFVSRYQWRSDAQYRSHVAPEGYQEMIAGRMVDVAVCPGSKWGELRAIMHGTTTVQGQSPVSAACTDRLARNADRYHGLGADFMRVTISGPCESGFPARPGLIADFADGSARRFVVHVGEGFAPHGTPGSSSDPTREFGCYAGRTGPAPGLLFDTAGVPYETAVMIHAVPLTATELDESLTANVRFVWSPSSNLVLYDRTAPIRDMLSRGLTIAIAPDWTPSGSDEMLTEMRYGYAYGVAEGIEGLTPQRLFEMATSDAANVLGLDAWLGALRVGMRADIVIFGRTGANPYQAVLESRAADVRLTMIDGAGFYGDLALEAVASINGLCDNVDVCGVPRFLCVQGTPGSATGASDTVDSLETELRRIMAVFGRESELLPLVDCTP